MFSIYCALRPQINQQIHYFAQIIRERISTLTLLLIAKAATTVSPIAIRLRRLCVRRNAVVLRCDWSRNMIEAAVSDKHYWIWLQRTAQSYESTEQAVGQLLQLSGWQLLSDKDFKRLDVRVREEDDY